MLKRLVGSAVLGMAGLGLVVLICPAWADRIMHGDEDRDCQCAPWHGTHDGDDRDDHDPHVACPEPIRQNCRVTHDPRWPEPVLKCRSIFPLPR